MCADGKRPQVIKEEKYLIMSSLTKMAYINENRRAFLMGTKEMAEQFVSKVGDVYFEERSHQSLTAVCSYCLASGADTIFLKNNKEENEKSLKERNLEKRYYNGRLSADITRLVHTQNKSYLEDFAECNFIVPIRIVNEGVVCISYATVKRGDSYIYLAFTDLEEYKKWEEKIPADGGWKPLQVDAGGLKRIGRDHGFVINIYGGRNVIKAKELKHIAADEMDDDE